MWHLRKARGQSLGLQLIFPGQEGDMFIAIFIGAGAQLDTPSLPTPKNRVVVLSANLRTATCQA